MNTGELTDRPVRAGRKPLRLWPGVVLAILVCLLRFGVPLFAPEFMVFGLLGGVGGALAILLWWLLFSRAPWSERFGAIAVMAVSLFATSPLLHVSIKTGAMGKLFPILAVPVLSLAFVAWAVASRRLPDGARRATMVATVLLACGGWTLVKTGGFTANFQHDLMWRWAQTPEERLLAQAHDEPAPLPAAPALASTPERPVAAQSGHEPAAPSPTPAAVEAPRPQQVARASVEPVAPTATATGADWPGFRGPGRDGIVRGVRIRTDWSASPPVEMWRRPIGPGWSSFAVRGDLLYTQEQRGDAEVVGCYRVTTGEPVWRHRDAVRFWESNAGAGPRATPTLSEGRVYTFGATGILNALDARTGAAVWSRDASADTKTEVPGWGFASSPLVVGDIVVVATAGTLAAFDLATGNPRWIGPKRASDYSSPHLVTIDGIAQVLLLNGTGATSVAPADGAVLWEHALPSGSRIVQPALTGDGDILMSNGEFGEGNGIRRIAVAHGTAGWTSKERWASIGLKPNFNDYVVHKGHAFGFDGAILACVDLQDGKRKWKGGRYGNGQLILLADQDLLLVLSEEGEVALARAVPEQFTELGRFPAIAGKTWNHPVLAGDVLLVRNGEEMAAFRLSLAAP
jgi:outer membrane protein assembly factor BamB